jgi:hypothetical protein
MTSTTPTSAPADLVGRGGIGARPAFGHGVVRHAFGHGVVRHAFGNGAARHAFGNGAARHAFGHGVATWRSIDDNGTTLGNLSLGRPQS